MGTKLVVSLCLLAPACLAGRQVELETLIRPLEGGERSRSSEKLAADDEALAAEARLEPILALALARNPDLSESAERVRARAQQAAAAGRLPDLELKYEQWAVPLARPWALDQAGMLMLGVRQMFPAPGSLAAEARAADQDARVELARLRMRRLELPRQIRRAYYEYVRAWQEYGIHLEHVDVTRRLIELGRANFRAGKGTQMDVLRLGVELARLHEDLAEVTRRKLSSAAMLNTLMARPVDAPLGPPAQLLPAEVTASVADLDKTAVASRPEIAAAEHALQGGQAALDAAERTASWPSFTVGVDYWLMPTADEKHAYGAMVMINLPWLNPGHRERVAAREHEVAADRFAIASARNAVRFEVRDAHARYAAARETFRLIAEDLLPQATRSFEAAQSTYAAGRIDALGVVDALRSLLEVRLDRVRAVVELAASVADLERATGADVAEPATEKGAGR